MSTFVVRTDPGPGDGPVLAVKDLIDVAGLPTGCGSRPVTAHAEPADVDAVCVARARAAGARIAGKTNLHELAFGGTGINAFTGTPVNPLDAGRIPGGSSSGSAVAVATGDADVALGTDTGGSIRTPSACCGTVGLKTTFGRIPLDGIRPLAPSLDTVGPMAATVDGVVRGMALLEATFVAASEPAPLIGRFRLGGASSAIESAIDALLASAGIPTQPCLLPGWDEADRAGSMVAFVEAHRVHADLLARSGEALGADVRSRLVAGAAISGADERAARDVAIRWRAELDAALALTPVIALVGMMDDASTLDDPTLDTRRPNVAVNLAGHPAIVLPVPRVGRLPASIQLVAAPGGEELLCATALVLEAAAD